ncbi:ROK family protein [Cupriavidus sp. TMH.W2]|uniref:ROK family protein n=1 Tax=Cupriavidus sp. TMH.W2 TaxID=3434465 RepID=UPI003D770CD1
MSTRSKKQLNVLVVDVGGSHVKCVATGHKEAVAFRSGPDMTPDRMMKKLQKITSGWHYDAVSIGYPGVVLGDRIAREPNNLGSGWIGFDFQAAFGCPVKIINDAAMQALGDYEGGRMLFLGLGTGLGSALMLDGTIAPMELGQLRNGKGHTYEDDLGERGRRRLGNKKWRRKVAAVVDDLRAALLPDYIVLGGGNAVRLKELPLLSRRGDNVNAFLGGFRMWERRAPNATESDATGGDTAIGGNGDGHST